MEQIRGTMPCQFQAPQYNAVKIDIHQPKVQAQDGHCHNGECCEHNLYGKKHGNSAPMPLPSNVIVAKQDKPKIKEQEPVMLEDSQDSGEEPVVVEEPIE